MSQFRLDDEYEEEVPVFTDRDEVEAGIEIQSQGEMQ